jgi:hypothetical protein
MTRLIWGVMTHVHKYAGAQSQQKAELVKASAWIVKVSFTRIGASM